MRRYAFLASKAIEAGTKLAVLELGKLGLVRCSEKDSAISSAV